MTHDIDQLIGLSIEEAERLAYSMGYTHLAEILAGVADIKDDIEKLEAELEESRAGSLTAWERNNGPAEEYMQFFYDCFEVLDGRYPCASVTNDYDKSLIFEAISRGVKAEAEA